MEAKSNPGIAAIILAAGGSSRMRPDHKLLLPIRGEAMIRHVVRAARAADLAPIVIVVGCRAKDVTAAIADLGARCLENPEWETGIASSIRRGIRALPEACSAAMILLADMPRVAESHLRRLSTAFAREKAATILVPTYRGKRGNPLLWGRRHFAALTALQGERGGRTLLSELESFAKEVPMEDDGILVDLDTPQELVKEALQSPSTRERNEKRQTGRGSSVTSLPH
ncbi:MAG: NTP transferase domain-containing protein [Candidatus Methylacidiphilaceae bacterium]